MKINFKQAAWYGAIVAVQLIMVLGFFVQRLYTLQVGSEIVLETRAFDPRDLVRGQYVDLQYEIGRVVLTGFADPTIKKGDVIFVTLTKSSYKGVFMVQSVNRTQPRDYEIYLKGTIIYLFDDPQTLVSTATIFYGIERYFIPSDTPAEKWLSGKVRVHARVDTNGNAVIERLEAVSAD